MPWGEILKKSWNNIRKYKFLWGLGILAALTEGSSGFSSYSGGSKSWSGSDSQQLGRMADSVSHWVVANIDLIVIALAALFVIGLIILYISYSARAGLIFSVNALESGLPAEAMSQALQAGEEKLTFTAAFDAGQRYFWQLLGLTLLVALIIFLAVAVFVGLILGFVVLAIISLWFLIAVIPLGLVLILALVVFCFYLNLVLVVASRDLIIADHGISAALKAGQRLIWKNPGQIILAYLINFGLSMAAGLALVLAIMVAGGALTLAGVGVYFIGKWTAVTIYAIPVGLALSAAILLVSGVINAFFSSFWTIVYKRLVP